MNKPCGLASLNHRDTNKGLNNKTAQAVSPNRPVKRNKTPQICFSSTYLYTEQEEVKVEVGAGQDVFVHNSHENRGSAVCQYRQDRVIRDRAGRSTSGQRWCLKGSVSLIQLVHLNRIVVAFFVFRHGVWTRCRRAGVRGRINM